MSEAPKKINCPFYGKHMHAGTQGPMLLIHQGGNECAAIWTTYSPCEMEIQKREIDWRLCPVITAISVRLSSRRNRARRTRLELLGPVASPLLVFISCALDDCDWLREWLEELGLNIRLVWGWWYEVEIARTV